MNGWPGTAITANLARLAAMDERHREAAPAASRSCAEDVKSHPSNTARAATEVRAWTAAICQGDEGAFTRFYDAYSLRLYRHLLVLSKGNETEASDVLQSVVIKLAKRFRVFDDEQQLWRWLSRLTQNAYVDLCRSRRREQRFVSLEEQHDSIAGEKPPEEHRLATGLRHALDQLEEQDHELMRAVYVDRRSLQELADASGQTYKAVESRLSRLRQKLKTHLLHFLRHENR